MLEVLVAELRAEWAKFEAYIGRVIGHGEQLAGEHVEAVRKHLAAVDEKAAAIAEHVIAMARGAGDESVEQASAPVPQTPAGGEAVKQPTDEVSQ